MNFLILDNYSPILMGILESEFMNRMKIANLQKGELIYLILFSANEDLIRRSGFAKSLWLEIYNYVVETKTKADALKSLMAQR